MTGNVVEVFPEENIFSVEGSAFEQGIETLLESRQLNPTLVTDNAGVIGSLYQESLGKIYDQIDNPVHRDSQPWGWNSLLETEQINAGLLTVYPDSSIPMHDHPGSTGLLVVLKGHVILRQYKVMEQSKSNKNRLHLKRTSVSSIGENAFSVFGPEEGNIHSLEADQEPCVLFDLMFSPYKPEDRSWFLPMDILETSGKSPIEVVRMKKSRDRKEADNSTF